jgi:hypothetical protein
LGHQVAVGIEVQGRSKPDGCLARIVQRQCEVLRAVNEQGIILGSLTNSPVVTPLCPPHEFLCLSKSIATRPVLSEHQVINARRGLDDLDRHNLVLLFGRNEHFSEASILK